MSDHNKPYDAIVVGAGVAGIYQAKMLSDRGLNFLALDTNADFGGTWFKNRYPGCRFDSESYTYGYKFSRELLNEWDWKEHFSPQPENLKYLNFVADKFDLRQYFRFNSRVQSMVWREDDRFWDVTLTTGESYRTRFVITCLGVLSEAFVPAIKGAETFGGLAFHTYDWPDDPVQLEGQKVGVIGTGATGIQIIAEIADTVGELTVFQRNPNWSVPLNNAPISPDEMDDIRSRYDEIFEICNQSQGGFCHLPLRREFADTTPQERLAFWDELYERRGFALLLANYRETFLEEGANRQLSEYVAQRIRQRVNDPKVAETLIPKDHGFGMRRLPLETRYFEAYNRPNVTLVDLNHDPINSIDSAGIQTAANHYDLDLIIYATGFEATTGALNAIDIKGVDGHALKDKWRDDTSTYLGTMSRGFPNMMMVGGPQSVSGSTNYPQAIETGVEWVTALLDYVMEGNHTRVEASQDGEDFWNAEVAHKQDHMPFRKVRSWFTGYNPNAAEGKSPFRYNNYWGGVPKYRKFLQRAADSDYDQIEMS
ncbi:NAD(P)-binding domain-containing protein [Erythrobacter sp. Alg231-14]|uniref:NAD(P)-binding domain-containing protein n=1 Tax=Erythrobacter sp. Alg231-14 TaxID=1922225 RepID=UPI000D554F0E